MDQQDLILNKKRIGNQLRMQRELKGMKKQTLINNGMRYEVIKSIESGRGYTIDNFLRYLSVIEYELNF